MCGNSRFERAMTCTDYYATGESFDLARCLSCGFQFTQNAPVETEMGRYYESPDYISHSDTQKGFMNVLYHRVRRYMLGQKARIVERESHLPVGRLLDIGTGTGYFSAMMQQLGWQVTAVEKSPSARQFAKQRFGLDVLPESELEKLPTDTFDAITLWHVMEHLEHLNDTWDKLYELLTQQGVLVVAVPNSASYDASYYGAQWAAYDVPRHLWHFTPATIKQLAAAHGFELTHHYPMPFDAFYISMLSEKHRKSSFANLKGAIAGAKAGWSARKDKEKSSSMIYIFRKKNQ